MNNHSLQELRDALLVLALPVTFQMHVDVGSRCRVATMARAFAAHQGPVLAGASDRLSTKQKDALASIDTTLACLCGEEELARCSDVTLRRHNGWRRVRWDARRALLAFGWLLELPARDAPIYDELRGALPYAR